MALAGKQATIIGGQEYEREEEEHGKKRLRRYINGYAIKFREE
jgi:hypothetical protein